METSEGDVSSDVSVVFSESASYETRLFDSELATSSKSAEIEVVIHTALVAQVESVTAEKVNA